MRALDCRHIIEVRYETVVHSFLINCTDEGARHWNRVEQIEQWEHAVRID